MIENLFHNFFTIFFHNLDGYWPSKCQNLVEGLGFRGVSPLQTPKIIFFLYFFFIVNIHTKILISTFCKSDNLILCQKFLLDLLLLPHAIKYRNINFVIEVSTRAQSKDNFILIKNKK